VGAAERLAKKVPERTREAWLGMIDEVRDRLAAPEFEPLPLDAFELSQNGKTRVITTSRPQDRLIEEALLPRVMARIEKHLSPNVHGYRPGRSTLTAAVAASDALAQGFHCIGYFDIADFYGSIDRRLLGARLESMFDAELVRLVCALLEAPVLFRGKRQIPPRGIPLGRALSPPLSNAYLLDLDRSMQGEGFVCVRYADDLLVLARDASSRDQAEAIAQRELARVGLTLKAEKRRHVQFVGGPIVYLGHTLDDQSIYQRVTDARLARISSRGKERAEQAQDGDGAAPDAAEQDAFPSLRSHTLYVTEHGSFLRVEQGLVIVQKGKETVAEIPLHRVDRILVMAGVGMSSGFLTSCVLQKIPVLFFVGRGRGYGSLVADGMPNPLRLRAQYDLVADVERRIPLARSIVAAKIRAMQRRLSNLKHATTIREQLDQLHRGLETAIDADSLRGYEGAATRFYYEGFGSRIRRPEFAFKERTKRPPKDPLNSLLSFAYSLIFSEMQTALLAHGLDPYPGFLHDLDRGHPALASDLSEPYRVLVADSFVLTVVNEGRVKPEGFEKQAKGAVYMTSETRHRVIDAYEGFMARPLGGAKGAASPRVLIDSAARAMLHVVLGEAEELSLPLTSSIVENSVQEGMLVPDAALLQGTSEGGAL